MIEARFDPELTNRIRKYADARFYQGTLRGRIRWMLMDETGTHVYCDRCGNIANGVLFEPVERYILRIPLCRTHLESWMKDHPEYRWHERNLALIQDEKLLGLAGEVDQKRKELMDRDD